MLALLDICVKSLDQGFDRVLTFVCLLIFIYLRFLAAVFRIRVLLKDIVVKKCDIRGDRGATRFRTTNVDSFFFRGFLCKAVLLLNFVQEIFRGTF